MSQPKEQLSVALERLYLCTLHRALVALGVVFLHYTDTVWLLKIPSNAPNVINAWLKIVPIKMHYSQLSTVVSGLAGFERVQGHMLLFLKFLSACEFYVGKCSCT